MSKNLSTAEQERLITAMKARRAENEPKMIDNGSLHAGSSMHYYCQMCCAPTATIAESDFTSRIPKHCAPCKEMKEFGFSEAQGRFLELAA